MNNKLFFILILICCIIISGSLIFHALCNRYQFIPPNTGSSVYFTFDKLTGNYYVTFSKDDKLVTKKRNDIQNE